jgi:lytic murein transglycosylase
MRLVPLAVAAALAIAAPGFSGAALAVGPQPKFTPKPNNCVNTSGPFDRWLAAFKAEAIQKGVRAQTVAAALDGIQMDPNIIRIDRGQSFFSQPFLDFSAKLATANRVNSGLLQMKKNAGTFQRAEAQYGVPAPVITAFWALESDFGAGIGKKPVLRSLVTLAWDCRRGEMFREELHAALRIIDKGDLVPSEMISSWAGELGQTQFLPTHYDNHAVDYDGDGKRNLFKSAPDIIGSTAKFIQSLGWKKGEPWLEEVRVPASMDWSQAGLDIKQPRSFWAKQGVVLANGKPLPADAMPTSLLLLQGRGGPAFLAYANFSIFTEWNQSLNYATTAAYLATRLAGAPVFAKGLTPGVPLVPDQIKALQTELNRNGFKVGEVDGRLGYGTRAAVRNAQKKFGLPADSYPTIELIERLRGPRG